LQFHKYLFFLIVSILNIKRYYPKERKILKDVKAELKALLSENKPYLWIKQADNLYYYSIVKSLHDMLTDITYIKNEFGGNGLIYTTIIKLFIITLFNFHKQSIKTIQGYSSEYKKIHPIIFQIIRLMKKVYNNLKELIK